MINLLWSGIVFVLLLSGCGWNGTPTRTNDFTPLASIEISAVSPTIAAGTSTKLSATGVYVGGLSAGDITDKVVWSSDANAKISSSRVTGLIPGTATLTATVRGVSSTFKLTVSSAKVTAMTITPANPSIAKGLTSQFTVSGTFDDTTTQDLTFDSTWESSDINVATISNIVDNMMVVNTHAAGTATIKATFTFNNVTASGSTLLTVTEPVLQSITLSPANPSILTLSKGKFTATGTYSDGSTPDLTSQVTWNSTLPAIATITSSGAVTTLTQGPTIISATLGSITGTTNLKVTGGDLTSFIVSPAIVTLVNNTNTRMTATGTFSNLSTRDITGTGAIQWTLLNPALATVTTPGGNLALLNALAQTGTTTVTATATSGTLIPFPTTLTVIAAQLTSIAILTSSPELTVGPLTVGTSARFTVTANFNGVTQDVTTLCGWTSDNTAVATVGTSGFAAGRVTAVGNGSTIIRATYTNGISAFPVQANVTVRPRTLQSLTITPSTVTIGKQVPFAATATYTDGTTKVVTEDENMTWSIDNPNVAILADSTNQPGQVVGVDNGSATLTASFLGMTPTQTTTIIVTGP